MSRAFTVLVLAAVLSPGAAARESVPGPTPAKVLAVLDGDTLAVSARVWPQHVVETHVRLRGIDAPERRGRCAAERRLAEEARRLLVRLVEGKEIVLTDISFDKYGGRMLASVKTASGIDVGRLLLDAGLARRYAGRSRGPWCAGDGEEPVEAR